MSCQRCSGNALVPEKLKSLVLATSWLTQEEYVPVHFCAVYSVHKVRTMGSDGFDIALQSGVVPSCGVRFLRPGRY